MGLCGHFHHVHMVVGWWCSMCSVDGTQNSTAILYLTKFKKRICLEASGTACILLFKSSWSWSYELSFNAASIHSYTMYNTYDMRTIFVTQISEFDSTKPRQHPIYLQPEGISAGSSTLWATNKWTLLFLVTCYMRQTIHGHGQ